MQHVCLISGAYPPTPCGVGDYTACLAKALHQQGLQVTVITSGQARTPVSEAGVTVYRTIPAWGWGGWRRIEHILCSCAPDAVHLQYPGLGYGRGLAPSFLFSSLAWQQPTVRRVLTLHEYSMFTWRGRLRLWPALTDAHTVICTNHADRRALRKVQRQVKPVQVIPLGSAVQPLSALPELFPRRVQASQTWMHFGSVMPNKGWEVLLKAWAQWPLPESLPTLEVLAELRPEAYAYHRKVAALRRDLGLDARVRFRGYLPATQVHEALRSSAGLAVMPFADGARLNRSSLVAMLSAGMAVVSTRPSAPLEGLRHGENIWYVAPENPAALLAGLMRVGQDAALAEHLQAGARRLASRFAWTRIAQRHMNVYG